MIKIQAGHSNTISPKTQKEARGGDKKWKLAHLPRGTQELFTDQLVPSVREKAGCLGPWEPVTMPILQDLIDGVYGPGVHIVNEGDVWSGLVRSCKATNDLKTRVELIYQVTYRLANWRNGFATAAIESVKKMINDNRNVLKTTEHIKDVIPEFLKEYPVKPGSQLKTAAFHWREWNAGARRKVHVYK